MLRGVLYRLAVQTLSGGAAATEEEDEGDHSTRPRPPARRRDQPLRVRVWRNLRGLPEGMTAAAAFVAMILVFSIDAKIDPGDDLLTTRGYETYADLTNDDVSTKPSGWTGREETAEAEIAQVKGANVEGRDLRNAYATGAFLAKAKLASGDLTGAELIGANLTGADLSGADLSGGKLTGADVSDALGVTQAELDEACGDEHTQLPQGLATSMCPVTAPQPSR